MAKLTPEFQNAAAIRELEAKARRLNGLIKRALSEPGDDARAAVRWLAGIRNETRDLITKIQAEG